MQTENVKPKFYLIVIPMNSDRDVHICGRCQLQCTNLDFFLQHKYTCDGTVQQEKSYQMLNTCDTPNSDNISSESLGTKSGKRIIEAVSNTEFSPLQTPHLITTNESLHIDKPDSTVVKDNGANYQHILLNQDYKRTFKNDEEDIATLLANQLSSQDNPVSSDDFNVEEVLYSEKLEHCANDYSSAFPSGKSKEQSDETVAKIDDSSKTDDTKSDKKILYRGKMRKLYSCHVTGCTYKTILRKDLLRHDRVHTGEKPYKCEQCEKSFTRADKLLLHQRIHAGDKRYKCVECDYACVDSGSLIKHLRIHSGERPFKCQLCAYRAKDSSQLTVHLRTHTGDSPFICTEEKCNAAFKTTSDLKRHMIIHSGEKPHACKYCDYRCSLKRNLVLHTQSQHPNGELKEYRCFICPKFILPTIRKLKNHLKQCHKLDWKDVKNGGMKGSSGTDNRTPEKTNVVEQDRSSDNKKAEPQPNDKPYFKRKRRKLTNGNVVAVGVMNKAYSCQLCNASFVCEESLHTHLRFHNKFKEQSNKNIVSTENVVVNENQDNLINYHVPNETYIHNEHNGIFFIQ